GGGGGIHSLWSAGPLVAGQGPGLGLCGQPLGIPSLAGPGDDPQISAKERAMAEMFDGRIHVAGLSLGTDPHSILKRVEAMEKLLERSFVIPGINRPVGLDAVAGLVPVVGDFVTAA